MTDRSFTMTFLVDQTSTEVLDAITNVRGWWSTEIDGATVNTSLRERDHHRRGPANGRPRLATEEMATR
jgi:hypothetical protein